MGHYNVTLIARKNLANKKYHKIFSLALFTAHIKQGWFCGSTYTISI